MKINRLTKYIIREREKGNKLILSMLNFISCLYYLLVQLRLFFYKTKFLRQSQVPAKVISIGNITLGGTGKTPAIIEIANLFRDKKLVVLSRGYKSRNENKMAVVSDGKQILLTVHESGDEPYLLSKRLPTVPIIIGQDRVKSAKYAIDNFGAEILILDDGFQYLPLKRDLDIVLIDGRNPYGNNNLFPAGILREPIKNLKRADIFIMTKIDQSLNRTAIIADLKRVNPDALILESRHTPIKFISFDSKEEYPLEFIKDIDILALSSIGDPESFEVILKKLTSRHFLHLTYPDHYNYTKKDVNKSIDCLQGISFIVTTEKDMVRLREVVPPDLPILYLMIRFEISTPNWQDSIRQKFLNF
ncbi:MAG: tetraacyldisaccharide 4'-kinase [bacterium]|nr:tetraacyldisaccharide 4'-kinase [bacterium]